MKNLIFILILTAFISLFKNEAKAQCPTGFTGTYTVTIPLGGDCAIVANYCLSNYLTPSGMCDIHFTSVSFIGDDCALTLPQLSNGEYEVPWGDLIFKIVNRTDVDHQLCFSIFSLPDCNSSSRTTNKVSTGGCYSKIRYLDPERGDVTEYTPCDITGISYCKQSYSFCKEYVNGKWVINVIAGDVSPQFTCVDENCFNLCN